MASRDLNLCVQELQDKVPLIITDYEQMFQGRSLIPICTLRSTQEQQELYTVGRTKPGHIITTFDGINKISEHNPKPDQPLSRAVDFGVFVGGKYITQASFYYPLLDLAYKYNLTSGLDFFNLKWPLSNLLNHYSFIDPPHIQIKET